MYKVSRRIALCFALLYVYGALSAPSASGAPPLSLEDPCRRFDIRAAYRLEAGHPLLLDALTWESQEEANGFSGLGTFRVRLYLDAGGLPGAIVGEQIVISGRKERIAPSTFRHTVSLHAVALSSDAPLWLEVQALGEAESRFGVTSFPGLATDPNPALRQNGVTVWIRPKSTGTGSETAGGVVVDKTSGPEFLARPASDPPPSLSVYPNPAAAGSIIHCSITAARPADLIVTDPSGRIVARLGRAASRTGGTSGGITDLVWDGRTDTGARAPGGTYFVITRGGKGTLSRKLVLLPGTSR